MNLAFSNTYSLLFFEGDLTFLCSALVLSDSLVALVLQNSDRVSTVTNVFNSQVNGLANPAVDATQDNRVLIDRIFLNALDSLFQKGQLVVLLELALTLAEGVISGHALKQILIDERLNSLEIKLVRVTLADLFTSVT